MAFDATAVYAGRSMIVYRAPFDDTNAAPALTVSYGTAWDSPWVDCGYTQDGAEWEISHDYADIEVDQELSPVLTIPSGQNVAARTNLAEFKMGNILLGTGQGAVSTTAAGSGTRGKNQFDLTSEILDNFYSFGMDFKKPSNGEALRAFIWKGRPVGSMTATFGVADSNAQIPIEIRAYPDSSTSPSRVATFIDTLPAT